MTIAPFKYIPPAGAVASAQPDVPPPKRKPEQQRIIDLNAASDYRSVGTEGLALMAQEKQDDEVVLIVANSLAWTGRNKEATATYRELINGKYANEANIGLANLQRWSGRDDLAAPIYRTVLEATPTNSDALEGMALATRELSPRTTFSLGASSDSSDVQRRSNKINHRWRDKSGSTIMEIEANAVKDWLPNIESRQQDVTVRYQDLALALKPSVELSMPTGANKTFYGSARIKLVEDAVSLTAGRVNWGQMANNPNALALGLSALHLGVSATQGFSFGNLTGRADYYDISDNNRIISTSVELASSWRPLGNNYKPFVGIQTRAAQITSPNYWSPEIGSGSLYAGLLGEWGSADWNFYASAQKGVRLYGDAGQSWAISGGGKRWLSDDIALSMTFWAMESVRNSASYKAQSATVSLEKLWK
jgi:tetratricopeptide (TPR) repeat protein